MAEEEFECGDCGRSFSSKRGLSVHQSQMHSDNTEETGETEDNNDNSSERLDFSLGIKQVALLSFFLGTVVGLAAGTVSLPELDTDQSGVVELQSTEFPYDVNHGIAEGEIEWARGTVDIDGRPYLGSADAEVKIASYEDFFCPYCGQHNQDAFPQLADNYISEGEVQYFYKHLPVVGGAAPAIAAECALEQSEEAFWIYKYNHFEQLDQLRGLYQEDQELYEESMVRWAEQLDLDEERFETCYRNQETVNQIQSDAEEGQSLGAQATPTIYINGEELRGAQPYSAFQQVIEAELG